MAADGNFVAEHDQFLKHLHIGVACASQEYALVRMPLSEHHLNGMGAAHGGVISALCDAAFGSAANSGATHAVVTVSLSVEFLRPGLKGPLQAEARRVHAGKRIVNYDIFVRDGDDQIIAKAMVSGYVTDMALQEFNSKKG